MEKKLRNPWPVFAVKVVSIVVVVVALFSYSQWSADANAADEAVREQIAADERAAQRGPFDVADGTYKGTARGYGGDVVVAVTIENGYIESVDDVSHANEDDAWWDLAKVLFDTIEKEQSTDVDAISSATYSSVGIINAAKKALDSAPQWEN